MRAPRHFSGRALTAMLLGVSLVVGFPLGVHADHEGPAAEQAAQEIQEARDRADAAAQALFDKEAEIDQLALDIVDTETELEQIETQLADMRTGLEEQAIRSYVGSGGSTNPLLIDIGDANDALVGSVYAATARSAEYVRIDDYETLQSDAADASERLADQQEEARLAVGTYATLIEDAENEVVRLGEIEARRVEDAEVQHALEAEQERRAEEERIERERLAHEAEQSQPQPAPATQQAPAAGGDNDQPAAAPPEPEPEPAPPSVGIGLVCPIAGPRSFANTWGAGRSGGRSHQGVDMMSPGGTPLVAIESGRVEMDTNTLGGNTVRLYGASGTRYYYAHLSAWEGGNRPVSAGDVIGYVGKTGNTQANHLHLQIHPGGGLAVNPYPYMRTACG